MTWLNVTDARCEALFASALQPSDSPTAAMVAEAISWTLRQFGAGGCAGRMAQEFGDHPDAVRQAAAAVPGVVLIDLHMPDCDEVQATRLIARQRPSWTRRCSAGWPGPRSGVSAASSSLTRSGTAWPPDRRRAHPRKGRRTYPGALLGRLVTRAGQIVRGYAASLVGSDARVTPGYQRWKSPASWPLRTRLPVPPPDQRSSVAAARLQPGNSS